MTLKSDCSTRKSISCKFVVAYSFFYLSYEEELYTELVKYLKCCLYVGPDSRKSLLRVKAHTFVMATKCLLSYSF